MWTKSVKCWKNTSKPDPSANESQFERHIQNSNPEPIESEPGFPGSQGATAELQPEAPRVPQRSFPLGMVLEACPDIADYARHGIRSWRDFVATARLVRSALGISPSAWEDARTVLGDEDAAVVVAAILQRGEAIKSPGGYLRSLTEKARGGAFSLGPVLMACFGRRFASGCEHRASEREGDRHRAAKRMHAWYPNNPEERGSWWKASQHF